MFEWLKLRLKEWLDINYIQNDIKTLDNRIGIASVRLDDLEGNINKKIDYVHTRIDDTSAIIREIRNNVNSNLHHNEELIKSFLSTCDAGYDLGITKYHKNWCVFAKTGKGTDLVKFIDLSHLNLEEIKYFESILNDFNKRNERHPLIDAPIGIKDYIL